jgi:hypothetical protein
MSINIRELRTAPKKRRKILPWFLQAGGTSMRRVWTVLIAVTLGLGVGACSKCDIPDLLPKTCKAGPGVN